MSMTTIGIVCIAAGVFAFGASLLKPPSGMRPWRRYRILIGGPVAIIIGVLILTGVIGG
ncbi:MAG: hypothetical protein MUO19_02170 [Dehalococcoidales bacterium]|nr:hypothetical protein [Dehalococcoidales bacterium]